MRSLLASAIVVTSLTLAGSGAMAAAASVHHSARVSHIVHARAASHLAARTYRPNEQLQFGIGQFIASMFGGGWPAQYASHARGAPQRSAGSYDSSPSFDTSPAIDTTADATNAQAASDAEVQAIQSMNDANALNASTAAAEQQNEAANAATLQTEINAGM
jgi:hypothetical protein